MVAVSRKRRRAAPRESLEDGLRRVERERALVEGRLARSEESRQRYEAMRVERSVRRSLLGLDVLPMPRGPLREEAREELDFETLTFPPEEDEDEPGYWGKYGWLDPESGLQIVPETDEERVARHNARDHAAPGTLTPKQWRALVDAFEHRCAYCGATKSRLVIEHVRPIFLGGRTEVDNVVPACFDCNREKGIRSLEEWQSSAAWWLAFIGRCALAAERYYEAK